MSRWLMSLGAFVVGANVAVAFVAVANVVGGLCRVTRNNDVIYFKYDVKQRNIED